MQIVSPQQMKKIESESEKYGVSKAQLMANAGCALAQEIDEYCRRVLECDTEKVSVVFLAGAGNNGGDCFAAARKLVFKGYRITVVNMCGKPRTDLAIAEFEKLPREYVKLIKAYRSENVNEAIEAAELEYMTLSCGEVVSELDKKDKKELTSLEKITLGEKERIENVFSVIADADVVVDGVFGTGFHGQLDDEVINFFAAPTKAYKISADVPSGGNSASGTAAAGTFRADLTLAFGALKTGMTQYPLKELCGEIKVVGIGIPDKAFAVNDEDRRYLIADMDNMRSFLPQRRADAYKNEFGRVLCIAGSARMRGAASLATLACLRIGAGLVCLASCEEACAAAAVSAPEATFLPLDTDDYGYVAFDVNKRMIASELERCDAVMIGCGLGVTVDTSMLVRFVTENAKCPVIIDADGINCISSDIDILKNKQSDIILTPHPGEMTRLLGCTNEEVNGDRFSVAENFAEKFDVTVLLKGASTVVADSQRTSVNTTGNPGMSRGGSGDVLSGIVAAMLARGAEPFDAARYAAYIHGLAGDIAAEKYSQEAMLPRDIIASLGDAFQEIRRSIKAI